MTKYEIREEGTKFAEIEAESAEEALAIAEREYPRRRSDYNMADDDEPYTAEWYAFGDEGRAPAMLRVRVPSR